MSKITADQQKDLNNLEKNEKPVPKWTAEQLKYFEYLENIVNAIPRRYGTPSVTPSVTPYSSPSSIKESNDFDNLQEMVNAIPKGYSIKEPKYYIPENESKSNTFLKTQRRKKLIEDPNCKASVVNNSVKCRSLNNTLEEDINEILEDEGIHIPEENNNILEEADNEILEEAGIHIPEKDINQLDKTKPRYRQLGKTSKSKKGGKTKRRRRRGLTRSGLTRSGVTRRKLRRTNNRRQRSRRLLKE